VSQGLFPQRCFSTAIDGWSSYTWHDRCNYRGPTLTVYRLGRNVTIASSISQSWVSRYDYVWNDWNARIYLLAQQVALAPNWNGAAYDIPYYGPTMGGGHDIYVDSSMRVQYCNCHTFWCPYGNICGQYNPRTLGIETYFWSPNPAPPPPPSSPPMAISSIDLITLNSDDNQIFFSTDELPFSASFVSTANLIGYCHSHGGPMTASLIVETTAGSITLWTHSYDNGQSESILHTRYNLGGVYTVLRVYITSGPFQDQSCHGFRGSITLEAYSNA
jgi:hypothetical protein